MGGIITGSYEMYQAADQEKADIRANRTEFAREVQQANTAIQSAQEKGSFESARQRILAAQLAAKQKQAYTASGVDATQGTAAAVQADTAALGEMDAQTLAINAAREAWGYREAKHQGLENLKEKNANASRKATGAAIGGYTKAVAGWMKMGGE